MHMYLFYTSTGIHKRNWMLITFLLKDMQFNFVGAFAYAFLLLSDTFEFELITYLYFKGEKLTVCKVKTQEMSLATKIHTYFTPLLGFINEIECLLQSTHSVDSRYIPAQTGGC